MVILSVICLNVYPNPLTSGQNLVISSKVKEGEIYNMTGQKVKSFKTQSVSSQGLEKGIYILKVTTDAGATESAKLIIK